MESAKNSTPHLDVEREAYHASRPGFRIAELTINATQKVPWHCHSHVQDTFYVLEGQIRIYLRDPKEEVLLAQGETYAVRPRRPHLVTNGGETAATFLVLQGIGEYDFIQLT
jgi:mannose-6-phosphate isomerase-like protein (cupin superfamily)